MKDQSNTGRESLEPERSEGGKDSLPAYNPEVPPIPKKRRFSTPYKLKLIKELERCKIPGGKGMILRREGLYSTQISQWKAQMGSNKNKAKSNSEKNQLERLKREIKTLKIKLEKSEKLIEIQKKMAKIIEDLNSNENASE